MSMDRPLAHPANKGWRKYRGVAIQAATVLGVVFGVASIVPLGMFLFAPQVRVANPDTDRPLSLTPAPPETAATVVFDDVNVVDVVAGEIREHLTLVIRNGTIESVGGERQRPARALVVDGRGRYLMPGLIDTHVHLTTNEQLLLYAARGVTTVQSLGDRVKDNQARAAAVEAGALAGPGVVSCDYVAAGVSIDAATTVADAVSGGSDCIKIYSPPDWTQEEYHRLIQAARARGLRIGGHLPRNLPLDEALVNGQQFVAHAEEFLYAHFFKFSDRFNEARLPDHARAVRESGLIVIPTLVAYHAIVEQVGPGIDRLLARPEVQYVPRDVLETWKPPKNRYRQRFNAVDGERLGAAFAFQQKLVRAWADAGVPLAVGTDASPRMPFVVPGFSALDELDELRQAGLSAAQVLRAATVDGARLIERSDRGVIAPGTRADVLLVEGNPLADVSNVRRIAGVMVKGRWMTAAWLEDQLRLRRQMSSIALAPGRPGSEEAARSTAVAGAVVPASDSRLKLAWADLAESAAVSPRVPR
jgi:imidazolonepropionase-like amidohydrolase